MIKKLNYNSPLILRKKLDGNLKISNTKNNNAQIVWKQNRKIYIQSFILPTIKFQYNVDKLKKIKFKYNLNEQNTILTITDRSDYTYILLKKLITLIKMIYQIILLKFLLLNIYSIILLEF